MTLYQINATSCLWPLWLLCALSNLLKVQKVQPHYSFQVANLCQWDAILSLVWRAKLLQEITHYISHAFKMAAVSARVCVLLNLSSASTQPLMHFYKTIIQSLFHLWIFQPSKQWYYQEHWVIGSLSINVPFWQVKLSCITKQEQQNWLHIFCLSENIFVCSLF